MWGYIRTKFVWQNRPVFLFIWIRMWSLFGGFFFGDEIFLRNSRYSVRLSWFRFHYKRNECHWNEVWPTPKFVSSLQWPIIRYISVRYNAVQLYIKKSTVNTGLHNCANCSKLYKKWLSLQKHMDANLARILFFFLVCVRLIQWKRRKNVRKVLVYWSN